MMPTGISSVTLARRVAAEERQERWQRLMEERRDRWQRLMTDRRPLDGIVKRANEELGREFRRLRRRLSTSVHARLRVYEERVR